MSSEDKSTKRLHLPWPHRGLSRPEAAAYVGMGITLFDQCVAEGTMPKPKRVKSRVIWDRLALDRAFSELPGGEDGGETIRFAV